MTAVPKQVEVAELSQAIREATDPLVIVNAFMRMPLGVEMLPIDSYWTRRVCAMAEMIVANRKGRK